MLVFACIVDNNTDLVDGKHHFFAELHNMVLEQYFSKIQLFLSQ